MAAVLGGAFLGGLADRMKENREYTKKKSDEAQAYLYNAGIRRQEEVRKQRQQLTEAADYLDSKGLEKSSLLAMLDENPREVVRLYGAALKAEVRGDLTPTLLNQAAIISAGYTTPDATASELIKAATPEFVEASELKKPEKKEASALSNMFRQPELQEIMYDVYSSDILGVKGKDIQASLSADLFKERTAGASEIVKTDLGVLADVDDVYDSTQKKDMRVQIQEDYNQRLKSEKDLLLNKLGETGITQIEKDTIESRVKRLRELEKMINSGSKNLAYQELMEMYDDIVKTYYATNPLARLILNDPGYFGLSPTQIENLFGE